MNNYQKVGICLISVLLWNSCGHMPPIVRLETPDLKIDKKFGIGMPIVYQYYEKFGFTDVCTHYRAVYRASSFAAWRKKPWQRLPLTTMGLECANSLNEKTDAMMAAGFQAVYREKYKFADIRLDGKEFVSNGFDSIFFPARRGGFHCSDTIIKIFDEEKKLLYLEYHKCN